MAEGRDIRFDFIRVISMFYIVAVLHLSQYIELPASVSRVYNPWISSLFTNLALSLFSMISGYLIGAKYKFGKGGTSVLHFYKKRILRFYPLFFIASWALYFIGFNSFDATLNGLLGIAVFSANEPRTLWYISMLMLFYLVTPIINRRSLVWKVIVSVTFLLLACLAFKLFRNVDFRMVYNLAFYSLGLVLSELRLPFVDKDRVIVSKRFQTLLNVALVILFIAAVPLSYLYCRSAFWVVVLLGVISVFALSDIVSLIKSTVVGSLVKFCSYGSMVCYMFHRVFYYVGLLAYNTDNQLYGGGGSICS